MINYTFPFFKSVSRAKDEQMEKWKTFMCLIKNNLVQFFKFLQTYFTFKINVSQGINITLNSTEKNSLSLADPGNAKDCSINTNVIISLLINSFAEGSQVEKSA